MTDQIMRAARELGIEAKVFVTEDQQLNPVVRVEGTHIVQGRIQLHWFLDSSLQHVKTILSDMYRKASRN